MEIFPGFIYLHASTVILTSSLPDVRGFLQNVDDFGEDDPAVGVYLVTPMPVTGTAKDENIRPLVDIFI
jgi:hypothetical protein